MNDSRTSDKIECGVDEAGAGCLSGPVYAGAVILPNDLSEYQHLNLSLIRDSKKLSEKQRYKAKEIIEEIALDYSVALIDEKQIDEINILNARIKAMHSAIRDLSIVPDMILVDGTMFKPYIDPNTCEGIHSECFEKGDSKYKSIASASILAKIARDEHMKELHKEFPMYNWEKNKGYGTKEHYNALQEHGPTKYHRMSFNLHLE